MGVKRSETREAVNANLKDGIAETTLNRGCYSGSEKSCVKESATC